MSVPRRQGVRVLQGGSGSCQTPVAEGAQRSGCILFLFLLFLTFAEAQRKTTKMSHSLFSFPYLLARSKHSSFGSPQRLPYKCHLWFLLCSEPLVLGLSLSPISCQP